MSAPTIASERSMDPTYLARFFALSSEEIFSVVDPDGVFLYVSEGIARLGYARDELVGTSLLACLHPEDALGTMSHLREATPAGPTVCFENRCRDKDGRYRNLAWRVSRAKDRTCAAAIRETTERHWVEHELEASLALVEATLESTADGILVADASGKVVTFNRRFLELWSVPDDVIFLGCREIDAFCEAALRKSEGHLSLSGELSGAAGAERYEVLTLEDGRVFERHSRARRIRDEQEGRVWSFRDVTQRVRAERELREHLSMGIEHAVEGIARLDESGCYLGVNGVFARMLGVTERELLGAPWGGRGHPDDRAALLAAREGLPPGGKREIEARAVRSDGSVVALRALLVRAEAGSVAGGYHVFMRDITEQRQMQERLLLADRMASMGAVAAGVAHEINNPLSFVIANAGLLAEVLSALAADVPDARLTEASALLADAREGAERVRKIVRDLKTFSRPEDARTGSVDLRSVLESSVNLVAGEVRHRARLVRDYAAAPTTMMVEGNEAQLGQVFVNLLVNAAQAIPEGSADRNEIRVVTRLDPDDAARVLIEVQDTGGGIPPAAVPHVFDPFFTTKPVGLGTGLGLSVCHGIVAKLGGSIRVESKVGAGTTFRVALRRAADRPKTERPPPAPPQGTRRRVLVVDDELMIGNMLRKILARDYDVVVCTSGRAALATVRQDPAFDLVLCDLMMPDVTGMDVHEALAREAPELSRRIVFMSGGTFTTRAKAFLDAVPNPRIDKPFDVTALRARIKELLPRD